MKYYYIYHIDEVKPPKKSLDDEDAPKWPFYIGVFGRSNTGKSNMVLYLFSGDKYYDMKMKKIQKGVQYLFLRICALNPNQFKIVSSHFLPEVAIAIFPQYIFHINSLKCQKSFVKIQPILYYLMVGDLQKTLHEL